MVFGAFRLVHNLIFHSVFRTNLFLISDFGKGNMALCSIGHNRLPCALLDGLYVADRFKYCMVAAGKGFRSVINKLKSCPS